MKGITTNMKMKTGLRKFAAFLFAAFLVMSSAVGVNAQGILAGGILKDEKPTLTTEYTGGDSQSDTLDKKYNIMLVIDKSGSMNDNDSKGNAKEAAEMFVDSNATSQCSIGVIAFSKDYSVITSPVNISDDSQRSYVHSLIEGIQFDKSGTGGTDIGRALKAAVDELDRTKSDDRENVIIFFTDGYAEGLSSEELANSKDELANGIELAKSLNCEIFTVGLNQKKDDGTDSIIAEGVQQIIQISSETQRGDGIFSPESAYDSTSTGNVNYAIIGSNYGTFDVYTKIIAYLWGANPNTVSPTDDDINGEIYTTFTVDYKSNVIKEANLYLTSETDLDMSSLVIRNPEGEFVSADGVKIIINNGRRYAFIKMNRPEGGKWKVSLKGKVYANLSYLLISDVEIAVSAAIDEDGVPNVMTTLLSDGKLVDDDSLYDSLEVKKIQLYDAETGELIDEGEMEYYPEQNNGIGGLGFKFDDLTNGKYKCVVDIENEDFIRTKEIEFTISNSNPDNTKDDNDDKDDVATTEKATTEEPKQELEKGVDGKYHISASTVVVQQFMKETRDFDNLITRYSGTAVKSIDGVSGESKNFKTTVDGTKIIVKGLKKCKTEYCNVDITATNGDKYVVELPVRVKMNIYIILGIIILAIAAIVGIIAGIKAANDFVRGEFFVEVKYNGAKYSNYKSSGTVKGRRLSAFKVVDTAIANSANIDPALKNEVYNHKKELKKILILLKKERQPGRTELVKNYKALDTRSKTKRLILLEGIDNIYESGNEVEGTKFEVVIGFEPQP